MIYLQRFWAILGSRNLSSLILFLITFFSSKSFVLLFAVRQKRFMLKISRNFKSKRARNELFQPKKLTCAYNKSQSKKNTNLDTHCSRETLLTQAWECTKAEEWTGKSLKTAITWKTLAWSVGVYVVGSFEQTRTQLEQWINLI